SAAIELALANYPGFFVTGTPGDAQSFGIYWPALVDATEIDEVVVMADGRRVRVVGPARHEAPNSPTPQPTSSAASDSEVQPVGPVVGEALGDYFAARSGDKGGNSNVGIWARNHAGFKWLRDNLTTAGCQRLLPEATELEVRRYELPNLNALNFVIVGLLGEGVASSVAFDAQAKGLGEYLLSRVWR
ncbi:MAG: exopolyphosphatase, partial [Actinobacteria bacterium]|nr:exopolyphosphatase [Actinomycetota bacterium]